MKLNNELDCCLKMIVFWVIALCSLVDVYWCFRGACYLQQGSSPGWWALMEAGSTSEMSINFYQTTRRNNPEDSHFYTCHRDNLKSHLDYYFFDNIAWFCPRILVRTSCRASCRRFRSFKWWDNRCGQTSKCHWSLQFYYLSSLRLCAPYIVTQLGLEN
jgi:hypothetical protein